MGKLAEQSEEVNEQLKAMKLWQQQAAFIYGFREIDPAALNLALRHIQKIPERR